MNPSKFEKGRRRLARLIYQDTDFQTHFNVPIKFDWSELQGINERLIEYPFICSEVLAQDTPQKILDFGCTRSWLSLALAAFGHSVLGIDLRPFPFTHPNLRFRQQNVLDIEDQGFDVIISLSTLEHVGLGVYDPSVKNDGIKEVLAHLYTMLRPGGRLILTLPVGLPSVDSFERSFSPEEIQELVAVGGFALDKARYFKRVEDLHWVPSSESEVRTVSNRPEARKAGGTGVNAVGCFVFSK